MISQFMMSRQEMELSAITTMCSSLESILKRCFGPNGLSVMLTTTTGTLMITGNGTAILQSLQLSHPIGRVVTNSIATHCQHTGDNSKTFVFLLCGILRRLCRDLPETRCDRMAIVFALAHLKHTVLPRLVCQSFMEQSMTICCTQDNLEQVMCACSNVFASTLQGRFNQLTARHLAKVLVQMMFTDFDVADIPEVVEEYVKHFKQVHVEIAGNSIQSTRIIDGIVVQRDMKVHVPSTMEHDVHFMLVAFDVMDGKMSSGSDNVPTVIRIASTDHLRGTFEWKLKQVQGFIQLLCSRGVNLILFSSVISDVLASHCRHAGISVIQAVDEDDMKRLAFVFSIHAVYCWSELLSTCVIGNADSCKPVLLGTHRWVLLQPTPATMRRCSRPLSRQLVVCAPTAGVCSQVASALLGCLKCGRMLFDTSVLCDATGRLTWPVPCTEKSQAGHTSIDSCGGMYVCGNTHKDCMNFDRRTKTSAGDTHTRHCHCVFMPGGGTFEGTLYKALQLYKEQCNVTSLSCAAVLLQHGLQSVSGHLAHNSFTPSKTNPMVAAAMGTSHSLLDGVIEPLASKVVLLCDLLTLLQQLLRVDMLVSVRRLCPTNDDQSNSDDSS